MILTPPYPARTHARGSESGTTSPKTLADLPAFLAHVMAYGPPADVKLVERFVPAEEYLPAWDMIRKALAIID